MYPKKNSIETNGIEEIRALKEKYAIKAKRIPKLFDELSLIKIFKNLNKYNYKTLLLDLDYQIKLESL